MHPLGPTRTFTDELLTPQLLLPALRAPGQRLLPRASRLGSSGGMLFRMLLLHRHGLVSGGSVTGVSVDVG